MKTKQRMRLEIKEISAEGTFEGLLSPYGNVDQGADLVEPGAYTKTLQEQGNKRPLLWQHKSDTPVGEIVLEDRPEGLWCKGQLLMALPEAQKAYLLIKSRIVKGLSIGFEAVKDAIENGVRRLKEIKLYEGSIVTFPMNESALIASVKRAGVGETKDDFNEELTEIQLQDACYQMRYALAQALSSIVWANLTREEKLTAAETIIQQFHDAFMAYLPAYLDMLTEQYGEMETWSKKRFETKEGRKFSAATMESMKAACDQIKGGHESLLALLAPEADEKATTLEDKAGAPVTSEAKAAALKSKPGEPHLAAQILDDMRSLIPA
jgi:HK97 family phage prohead protease